MNTEVPENRKQLINSIILSIMHKIVVPSEF